MRNLLMIILIISLFSCTAEKQNTNNPSRQTDDDKKIFMDSADDENPKAIQISHKYNKVTFNHPKFNSKREKDYVLRFYKVAQEEHKLHGIPASVTLAQGIYESTSGTSKTYKDSKNHFGVKWTPGCGFKYIIRPDDKPDDRFRKYKSDWWSFRDRSKFLMGPRYAPCRKCGDDWKCWAKQLKKCGYATSKKYTETLINIIQRNKLYVYDSRN